MTNHKIYQVKNSKLLKQVHHVRLFHKGARCMVRTTDLPSPLPPLGVLLCVASATKWHLVVESLGLECMHAKENRIDNISHMQHWLKLKKSINHKPNIEIKFRSHHWISDNKNFETDPTWLYFDKFLFVFLIRVIYFVIATTKRMKCQNKREQQLSEQVYMSSRITNVVSEQIRIRVRHMLLL
jgi:hypothetical protein